MKFSDIVGQREVIKRLIQTVEENRISHAQLFLGPQGSGNLALALAYAQYISCQDRKFDDSCGECLSCIKYQKLIHPDLHFAFPVASTREFPTEPVSNYFLPEWRESVLNNPYLNLFEFLGNLGIENKQGNISVKECQDIIKKLSLKSFESEYKVMIIWMPEKMMPVAANRLLKTLEEPPEKTLFILVTENQDQLLKTIISRTQLVKINKLKDSDIADALLDDYNGYSVSPEKAATIARLADGDFNEALRMLEEDDVQHESSEFFQKWMRICYKREVPEAMNQIEEFAKFGRERQKNFFAYCLDLVRECMLLNYTGSQMVRLAGTELGFAEKFAPFINQNNIVEITEEINKASYHIERNANPKVLFLDLSFKLFVLLKK